MINNWIISGDFLLLFHIFFYCFYWSLNSKDKNKQINIAYIIYIIYKKKIPQKIIEFLPENFSSGVSIARRPVSEDFIGARRNFFLLFPPRLVCLLLPQKGLSFLTFCTGSQITKIKGYHALCYSCAKKGEMFEGGFDGKCNEMFCSCWWRDHRHCAACNNREWRPPLAWAKIFHYSQFKLNEERFY